MTHSATFTPLHVHSHYTLLGATPSIPALVQRAGAAGLTALALTDTHALYGAVAFERACQAANIRPIIGMTVQLAALPGLPAINGRSGEIVLLAKNRIGYQSLCRLSSHLQNQKNRSETGPTRLDWPVLQANHAGLIGLFGGQKDWLTHYWHAGQKNTGTRYLSRLAGLFEEDGYLAVSLYEAADTAVARELIGLGDRFGVPAVAVQPVYCLEPDEAPLLTVLAAIARNGIVGEAAGADGDTAHNEGRGNADVTGEHPLPEYHWQSPAAMAVRFADFPDLLAQTNEIARQCGPVLPDGQTLWPALDLPVGQSAHSLLQETAVVAFSSLYGSDHPARDRLHKELSVIEREGFAPLFLIVADITRFAREAQIPTNTRGSVANSLVAYCLGITSVDPVTHDLLFERFLNPARANLPDIDLDFCSRRRDEVLHYIRQTYGADRVALVATVNTLRLRSAVRETGKAHGLPEKRLKYLANLVPRSWHPDPRRRSETTVDDIIDQLADPLERTVVSVAAKLVGQPDHLGVHPGGIVITPGPLTETVPVQWAAKGFLVTQFDHHDVEKIGLPKIDLLGIRALTVLADTAVLIRQRHDPDFRLEAIPTQDAATATILSQGDTVGVFQCESEGAQRTLRQLRANSVADLAIANAFFKPGPATGGMAKAFVRRYRGEEPVSFLHPALAPILGATQGVLLFQEQILRIAVDIARLSWSQADVLRRGMSKFKGREMATLQVAFVTGCMDSDFSREQAETLWEQVMAFAGYGFNQGHATAYAGVSYQSAYLRAHYPAEFMCARLMGYGGFHHPALYVAETVRLGFPVRPPHVNKSGSKIRIVGQESDSPLLWLGLGQIRSLRRESVRAIVAARQERPFTELRDLIGRVTLQTKEVTHLIQCGALDGLGESRAALLAEADALIRAGSAFQLAFDFGGKTAVAPETIGERLEWEQHILGWPVSVHPLDLVSDYVQKGIPLRRLPELVGRRLTIAGTRLPGWTGGKGFFLGDGDSYVIIKPSARGGKIRPWDPLLLNGRFLTDEWGGGWFQADNIEKL